MITHIISEYTIGIFTSIAFILLLRKSKYFKPVWFFTIGMHFYAAIQAIGWAFAENLLPVFINLIINTILIVLYLSYSFYKLKDKIETE